MELSRSIGDTAMNWKKLLRSLRNEPEPLTEQPCQVHLIDDTVFDLNARLGVTLERTKQLRDHLLKCYNVTNDYAETMSKVSEYCKHPNELALCCFCFGYIIGENYTEEDDGTDEK